MIRKDETRQLTETAFWTLLPTGTVPTVDSVNAWLDEQGHGRRNRNVISDTLKGCWSALGTRVREINTLPGIPDETVQLVLKLRDDMLALARQQFADERAELERDAGVQIEAARREAADARAAAEEAKQGKREADSAFVTLQEEHQRVIGEAKSLRVQLEESSRQLTDRDIQIGQLREALEREQRERARDRETADAQHRRLTLEIDQLRTENKAQGRAFEKTLEKAQAQLDAAATRERELREENARLHADLGALRGAQQVLKENNAELTAERDRGREAAAAHAERAMHLETQMQVMTARLAEYEAELDTRAPVAAQQLHQIVADAYSAGASSMTRVAKGKDPAQGVDERAEDYAKRHVTATTAPRARRK
jgi:chromosome segregation ATPase